MPERKRVRIEVSIIDPEAPYMEMILSRVYRDVEVPTDLLTGAPSPFKDARQNELDQTITAVGVEAYREAFGRAQEG